MNTNPPSDGSENPHVHVSFRHGVTANIAEEALKDPAFVRALEDMAKLLRQQAVEKQKKAQS